MKQSQKLDALIKSVLKEELGSIQELSPALMNRAAKKAEDKIDPWVYDNPDKEKKQAKTLDSHINPEVKKEVDRVKNIIGAQEMNFRPFNAYRNGMLEVSFGKGKGLFLRVTNNPEIAPSNKKYKIMGHSNMKMEDLPKDHKKAIEDLVLYIAEKQVVSEVGGEEGYEEYVTQTGTASSATGPQKKLIAQKKPGSILKFRKPGASLEENETQELETEQQEPTGTDIAGQVAEIVEKLKIMSESGKDPKKQRLVEKVMKYMESAKAALEALTGHESMLEEKDQEAKRTAATKKLKGVRTHLGKIIKDKEIAERVMGKMPVEKMMQLASKAKKDIDEAGLAKLMVKHSLQEAWLVKKK
jgi:hypothetical protein